MKYLFLSFVLILIVSVVTTTLVHGEQVTCFSKNNPACFLKRVTCPHECPSTSPSDPTAKVCFLNCASPLCKAECKHRKPNCNGPGAACLDPRFIGGDGVVFYFHGRRNENFALVSDKNFQINARFIGLRPEGRPRDFTWIQALGILTNKHFSLSVEATKATQWDPQVDHLKFSYNGRELDVPARYPYVWENPSNDVIIERTSQQNSALITLRDVAEVLVNVVPITKEDDRIHNYRIPSDDCFAHLEVQFRLYGLSGEVEGVLGKTYRPDYVSPAKPGVAVPVLGGEDRYGISSLFDTNCNSCVFKPNEEEIIIDNDDDVLAASV